MEMKDKLEQQSSLKLEDRKSSGKNSQEKISIVLRRQSSELVGDSSRHYGENNQIKFVYQNSSSIEDNSSPSDLGKWNPVCSVSPDIAALKKPAIPNIGTQITSFILEPAISHEHSSDSDIDKNIEELLQNRNKRQINDLRRFTFSPFVSSHFNEKNQSSEDSSRVLVASPFSQSFKDFTNPYPTANLYTDSIVERSLKDESQELNRNEKNSTLIQESFFKEILEEMKLLREEVKNLQTQPEVKLREVFNDRFRLIEADNAAMKESLKYISIQIQTNQVQRTEKVGDLPVMQSLEALEKVNQKQRKCLCDALDKRDQLRKECQMILFQVESLNQKKSSLSEQLHKIESGNKIAASKLAKQKCIESKYRLFKNHTEGSSLLLQSKSPSRGLSKILKACQSDQQASEDQTRSNQKGESLEIKEENFGSNKQKQDDLQGYSQNRRKQNLSTAMDTCSTRFHPRLQFQQSNITQVSSQPQEATTCIFQSKFRSEEKKPFKCSIGDNIHSSALIRYTSFERKTERVPIVKMKGRVKDPVHIVRNNSVQQGYEKAL